MLHRNINRYLSYALPALITVSVYVLTQQRGPGISPDSIQYIAAADDLAVWRLPRDVHGEFFALWGPFFPLALSLGVRAGIHGGQVGSVINTVALGILVFLWLGWTMRTVRLPWIQTAAIALFCFGGPLLYVSMHIWSEPIFILLVSVHVVCLAQYLGHGGRSGLVLSSVVLALACLSRYVGMIFLAAAFPMLFVAPGQRSFQHRAAVAFAYAGLSALPVAVWMIVNLHYTGHFVGDRVPGGTSPWSNLSTLCGTMSRWFGPYATTGRGLGVFTAVGYVFLAGVLAHLLFNWRRHMSGHLTSRNPLVYLWPAVVYVALMLLSAAGTQADALNDRMLSPVFPLLVASIMLHADHISSDGWKPRKTWRRVVTAVCILVTLTMAVRFVHGGMYWLNRGVPGLMQPSTQEAVAQARDELEIAGAPWEGNMVWSNQPYLLYLLTGTRSITSPRKHPYGAPERAVDDLARLKEAAAQGARVKLIWFITAEPLDYVLPRHEIERFVSLSALFSGVEVTVYKVAALPWETRVN